MTSSHVVQHAGGGQSFVGADAVKFFQVTALAAAIKLYDKCGMIPSRGVTISKMMKSAEAITGKKYKRGAYLQAHEDLMTWSRTMKAALPFEDGKGNPI